MTTLSRSEWTLLMLASADRHTLDKFHLQKALFLLGKWLPDVVGADYYQFEPNKYGAFSWDVYADTDALTREQLAMQFGDDFTATAAGRRAAEKIPVSPETRDIITRIADWVGKQSFDELAEAMYRAFPETASNTVLRRRDPAPAPDDNAVVDWFDRLPGARQAALKALVKRAAETKGDPEAEEALLARESTE